VRPLGIAVRSGLHTGEIELTTNDVTGTAVHIAGRVAAQAAASETVVSSTVRDLVAGSGLHFEDRGIHALKGLRRTCISTRCSARHETPFERARALEERGFRESPRGGRPNRCVDRPVGAHLRLPIRLQTRSCM
jgi:class 3 adenylate cyclase